MTPIEQARAALKPFANIAANLDRLQEMDRSAAINMTSVHGTGSGASGHLGTLTEEHFLNARRALAALARIEAEGWRPIETAPKDGSTIIGWSKYCLEPVTVRWVGNDWQSVWERGRVVSSQSDFGTDYETPGPLTHWRPLPAPPEEPR